MDFVIKAVFFDLDDTLFDRESAVRAVVAEQYRTFRAELERVAESDYVARVLDLDDHGLGDKDALYKAVATEWKLEARLADQLLRHFWGCYQRHYRPTDGAVDTLRILRARGRKLGLITNGTTDGQQAKVNSMAIAALFDVVLISEAEGIRKPDPAIFRRACDRCGVRPEESLFVGDNPETDIAGARAAGMGAIWKRVAWRAAPPPDVPVVDRLADILATCLAP